MGRGQSIGEFCGSLGYRLITVNSIINNWATHYYVHLHEKEKGSAFLNRSIQKTNKIKKQKRPRFLVVSAFNYLSSEKKKIG